MLETRRDSAKNTSLSEDLTVILLRGNGSPRTFRLPLPALQRSLTALGFAFALAVLAAIFFFLLNLFRFTPDRVDIPSLLPSVTAVTSSTATPASGSKEDELQKEVTGLREDIAKLNFAANGRKPLAPGANPGLLQFFGPTNVAAEEKEIQVKNAKIVRDSAKNIYLDFEIHNVDPEQKPVRGYIVVMAKTPAFLAVYPEGAFNPSQNVVLDFTKGETFSVSRFRQVRATFSGVPLEGKKPKFQALLFKTDGSVIADLHVEDQP